MGGLLLTAAAVPEPDFRFGHRVLAVDWEKLRNSHFHHARWWVPDDLALS